MSQAAIQDYRIPRFLRSPPVAIVAVALLYAAVAQAGLLAATLDGRMSPIYPSAGIALAAVLILGRRALAGIWLGSCLANLVPQIMGWGPSSAVSTELVLKCLIALGAMAGAGSGAILIRRCCPGHCSLSGVRSLVVLVVVGALGSSMVSPTIGVLSLSLAGAIPWSQFQNSWFTWWIGDASGVLVATPLLLAWLHRDPWDLRLRRIIEAAALTAALVLLCLVVFFGNVPLEYGLTPLLLWSAFRFGMRGASAAAAVIALLATIGTCHGSSPFSRGSENESLLLLHSFLSVNVIGALFLAAIHAERKRAEDEVLRARDEAQAASQAKDRFMAAASHELRTPLTPILLLASSLEQDAAINEEVRKQIASIREHAEMEKRLVDDLLDFTAIHAGKLQLTLQNASLHSALQAAIDTCMPEIRRKHLGLGVTLGAAHDGLLADPGRLRQTFWNVLQNAAKFTPEHGRISVRTDNDPAGSIRITIADTGKGIDAETMSRLFLPFEQGPRTEMQHYGGLGLGLAIARTLAERHGGTVAAASAGSDQGTTFTLQFPLANSPAKPGEAMPATPPAIPVEAAASGPRPLRVLLVEDHNQTRAVLARLLTMDGHSVTAAANVAEATAAAASRSFELVLSDIGLPDGSGLGLMSELRERYHLRGIALSGYDTEADRQAAFAAGFLVHLSKPVSVNALREALLRASVLSQK